MLSAKVILQFADWQFYCNFDVTTSSNFFGSLPKDITSHDFCIVFHINTKILIAINLIPLSAGETVNNNFEITVLVSIF